MPLDLLRSTSQFAWKIEMGGSAGSHEKKRSVFIQFAKQLETPGPILYIHNSDRTKQHTPKPACKLYSVVATCIGKHVHWVCRYFLSSNSLTACQLNTHHSTFFVAVDSIHPLNLKTLCSLRSLFYFKRIHRYFGLLKNQYSKILFMSHRCTLNTVCICVLCIYVYAPSSKSVSSDLSSFYIPSFTFYSHCLLTKLAPIPHTYTLQPFSHGRLCLWVRGW